MEQVLYNVAQTVEKQLDSEIKRLDQLDSGDLEAIRQQRIAEMKQREGALACDGHGEYTEIDGEKEFFGVCGKSENVVCHFYRSDTPRCRIVDIHLHALAKKHVETRFVKLDVERAPFLTGHHTYVPQTSLLRTKPIYCRAELNRIGRLKVRVLPTIALVKDNKTRDFIVGFTELGNRDDFSTDTLEWRIARSEVIESNGDLLVPPEEARKQRMLHIQSKRTIRGAVDSDSDGLSD